MSRKGPRRRLRIRRKRKGKSVASQIGEGAAEVAGEAAVRVVGEYGCLVVESVISASVLALLIVPAYLLMR